MNSDDQFFGRPPEDEIAAMATAATTTTITPTANSTMKDMASA